jgi:hypothetical protein
MSDDSPNVQTFESPPDIIFQMYGILIFIFLSIFFIILYIIAPNPIILIFGLSVSLLWPALTVFSELVSRPKQIDIDSEGVRFCYRLPQPKTITWEDIHWIYVSPSKYTTVTGKDKRRGVIKIRGMWTPNHVTYDIGLAIRSAYQRYHGPLPELPDDWKNRPY